MTTQSNKTTETVKSFKIILVGSSAVGKSTLLVRYVDGIFNSQKPTVGLDYRSKKITLNNETFNMELWDSAGQQRYRTIVFNYFKLSKAACIVFDVTNPTTLEDTKYWFKQVQNHCGPDLPKILIGNKADLLKELGTKEEVDKHLAQIMPRIEEIQKEFNAKYFQMSAYTGEGVNQAFDFLFKELYKQHRSEMPVNPVPNPVPGPGNPGFGLKPVTLEDKKKKQSKCC